MATGWYECAYSADPSGKQPPPRIALAHSHERSADKVRTRLSGLSTTVSTPEEVEEEIRHLFSTFGE
jgi:hypothetical protein